MEEAGLRSEIIQTKMKSVVVVNILGITPGAPLFFLCVYALARHSIVSSALSPEQTSSIELQMINAENFAICLDTSEAASWYTYNLFFPILAKFTAYIRGSSTQLSMNA